MKTQEHIVLKRLNQTGKVDNIWAVNNYILRLSAIVFRLKKQGYRFHTYFKRDKKGRITKQYVYELIK